MIQADRNELWTALRERAPADGVAWLEEKTLAAGEDPGVVAIAFPAVGRKVGRGMLDPASDPDDVHAWTLDDAGRTLLLRAAGDRVGDLLEDLYRHGDAAERRGVLRALPFLPLRGSAVRLVDDALRTNDARLIAAAMGPYALAHLDDAALAQAVLKCVFVGIPVSPLPGLEDRVTPDLSRMLAGYVHERVAAGRDVPAEVWKIIDRHPPTSELRAIFAELEHPVGDRRRAAAKTLADRRAVEELAGKEG